MGGDLGGGEGGSQGREGCRWRGLRREHGTGGGGAEGISCREPQATEGHLSGILGVVASEGRFLG